MIPLLVLLTLAAPSAKKKPKTTPAPAAAAATVDAGTPLPDTAGASLEQAGEVKEIELDEKRARAVYRIKTAISIPAVVEFPEPMASPPACGDCADASKPGASSALFALQAEPNGNYLVVKPRLYPGPQGDGSNIPAADFVTTITVRLQSLTLTLQVELTEDKHLADPRVRFTLPNRAAESRFVTDSIAKARSALEADFAGRVEAAASEQLLRQFLEPHQCRSASARQRTDDMVLELRELCRFGHHLYVRFGLENRGRSLFVIDAITAGAGEGEAFTPVEARVLTSLQEVAFQQTAEGVVELELDASAPRALQLIATERGGRSRSIALKGFGL